MSVIAQFKDTCIFPTTAFVFESYLKGDTLLILFKCYHQRPKKSELSGSHCVPCNAFGEQREIYEWIRLFREVLFLCQGGAYFWSGGRSFHFRRALFGP